MGLLGTHAILEIDINLLIQVIAFAIVLVSLFYKQKTKYKIHGGLMGAAVLLHFVSFLVVMRPSLSNNIDYFTQIISQLGALTTWVHLILGAVAMITGLILVFAWAVHPSNISGCFKRKRLMDVTILFWFISLIFGIATYIVVYI
jgi:uncharacterized membrane protein YozB (DUF420 family)